MSPNHTATHRPKEAPAKPAFGGFYGWHGRAWAKTPDVTQYDQVAVKTTMWAANTQKVIWTVTMQGIGASNVPKIVQDLTATLIPEFKSNGVSC